MRDLALESLREFRRYIAGERTWVNRMPVTTEECCAIMAPREDGDYHSFVDCDVWDLLNRECERRYGILYIRDFNDDDPRASKETILAMYDAVEQQ